MSGHDQKQRFRPYPAYTDSGVEWLGDIPAHRRVAKMWDVVEATGGTRHRGDSDGQMASDARRDPPATEQEAIAVFLDRETARIDVLMAQKERLIELLHSGSRAS